MDSAGGRVAPRVRVRGYHGAVLDVNSGILRRDRVLVQAGHGGYVAAGFGTGNSLLRRAYEDATHPAWAKSDSLLAKIDDPHLQRLAIAEALYKDEDSYDPDQPRDQSGRWTSQGGGVGTGNEIAVGASISATASAAEVFPFEEAGAAVLAGLETLGASAIAAAAGAAAVLGILFFPTNKKPITEAPIEGWPDLAYRYNQDDRTLEISQNGKPIFTGQPDRDGLFRDAAGKVIGCNVGGAIAIDSDGLLLMAPPRAKDNARSESRTDATTENNDPKACPAPEKDRPGTHEDDYLYTQSIAGQIGAMYLPAKIAVRLRYGKGYVYFDTCRPSDGTMIETKANLIYLTNGLFVSRGIRTGFSSDSEINMLRQAAQQIRAAGISRNVEWHFAQKKAFDIMEPVFAGRTPVRDLWPSKEFLELTPKKQAEKLASTRLQAAKDLETVSAAMASGQLKVFHTPSPVVAEKAYVTYWFGAFPSVQEGRPGAGFI